jgi:hypothetical protein
MWQESDEAMVSRKLILSSERWVRDLENRPTSRMAKTCMWNPVMCCYKKKTFCGERSDIN